MSDLIERKDLGAAIDNWLAIDRYYHPYSKQKTIPVSELVDIIKLLPSAQPEITAKQVKEYCKENGYVVLLSDEYNWLKSLKRKSEEFRWNGGGNY